MTIQRELLAACWTWAGDVGPGDVDQRSPIPLGQRVEAVAASGWDGVGICHADLVEFRDTLGLRRVRTMLDDAGIRRVELEFLTDWWQAGERRRQADRVRDDLFDAAAELGVTAVKVGAINDTPDAPPPDPAQLSDAFHQLAERARSFDLRVGFEPLGGAHISTLADSIHLVRAADHPNGGLVVDVYHCVRSGEDDYSRLPTLLAGVPIVVVELGDAPILPDGKIGPRCLPGTGDLDVSHFIAGIWRAGWRGHWGVEIISDELRALPLADGLDTVRKGIDVMLDNAEHLS